VLPPARGGGVDESWMIDVKLLVSEAQLLQRPGAHILHEDISVVEQCLQLRPAVIGLEVENYRLLVAIEPNERTRLSVDEWPGRLTRIAAGLCGLDGCEASSGHLQRLVWGSDECGELGHCDCRERSCGSGVGHLLARRNRRSFRARVGCRRFMHEWVG